MLLTLNAEVEYCPQGQVLFRSWTSPVPQGRAAGSSSGYHEDCLQNSTDEGLTNTKKIWESIRWRGSRTQW